MSDPTPLASLMQGNEAVARAALAAGVSFYAGYPITPSTEIAEYMARYLPEVGGIFIQMEDEISSLAAVIGASVAGSRAMTATSGPGFSLMQENLGFAVMAEVPLLLVNVMRQGPSTGMPTAPGQGDVMQARWGSHGDRLLPVFVPATVSEAYDLTITALRWSEELSTPVVLLMDEVVGHLRERVVLPPQRPALPARRQPACPPEEYLPYRTGEDGVPVLATFGSEYRYNITGLVHDQRGLPSNSPRVAEDLLRRLRKKIVYRMDDFPPPEMYQSEGAEYLVIAYGGVARAARQAVRQARQEGLAAGIFRPVTLWPFPGEQLAAAAAGKKGVVIAEMNDGQLAVEIERWLPPECRRVYCLKNCGELIAPTEIFSALREVAGRV
ncbi:MAG: 2-oxoacid:acceptor oxidoreductase subunit alpha [Bacillota bacterium]|uniref:2-oxoacid:acceptor oxidoreductase subunit alpha n=1 Tax=Desulfurispora thermophila TaxID=265470 RepID=UPI00036094DE|nr:2-oxoacid:acceptor oxidoreductase subunit alpha [Desulfurispora thermophila]